MRSDMLRVIAARRSRQGGACRKPRPTTARIMEEADVDGEGVLLERHASYIRPHVLSYRNKNPNEDLSPLKRFLRTNLGRPWDDVMSEICAHFDSRSPVHRRVLKYLDRLVLKEVVIESGKIFRVDLSRGGGVWPMRPGMMYVDPGTGLLSVA